MKRIVLLTLAIVVVSGALYLGFERKAERLRSEYARAESEKLVLQQTAREVAELAEIYGEKGDVVTFTEALYGCARNSGIDDHEVITSLFREEPQARGGRQQRQGKTLEVHRLEVSLSGKLPEIAEYIDELQQLKGQKRITRLTLTPGENVLKAKLFIDLYSLGGRHAR